MNKEEIYYWIKIFQKYQQSFRSADNKEISFCKILKTLDQLQNNWNELKKFVDERIKFIQEEKAEFEEDLYNDYETNKAEITIRRCNLSQLEDVLEKMQELEGENNNEEKSNSK